jgi:hypothetical protein
MEKLPSGSATAAGTLTSGSATAAGTLTAAAG